MKFSHIGRSGRARVLVAGALAVPVVLGSVALASAATQAPQPAGTPGAAGATPVTSTATSQLTDEGKALAEKSGTTSGSVTASIGADGKVHITKGDALPPAAAGQPEAGQGAGTFTGSAALTKEGEAMVEKSGKTSGSVTASATAVQR